MLVGLGEHEGSGGCPAVGVVFYDRGEYSDNWRYLEAAPDDEPDTYIWGQYGSWNNACTVETGSGRVNTLTLLASEKLKGCAIAVCRDNYLTVQDTVSDDWFLPSRDELQALAMLGPKANLSKFCYWSSSEVSPTLAWDLNMVKTTSKPHYKNTLHSVRAIRVF